MSHRNNFFSDYSTPIYAPQKWQLPFTETLFFKQNLAIIYDVKNGDKQSSSESTDKLQSIPLTFSRKDEKRASSVSEYGMRIERATKQ